jgi:opacity protein-like surface antigen
MNGPSARLAVIVSLMLFALPAAASADFFVVPFAGIKFGGSTSIVDLELAAAKKTLTLGASASRLSNGIVGYEFEFGSITGYFESGDLRFIKPGGYVIDLSGNLLLSLPPGATGGGLRPYVVAGGGLIHAEAEDFLEIFQIRRTVPSITLGAGAVGLLSNNVGIRFDVRHLRSLSKDASVGLVGRRIAYSRFTIGLLLRL